MTYKVAQPHRLAAAHDREDDRFFRVGIGALCAANGCGAVELLMNKITDRFGVIADDGEIFAQVNALNRVVNYQRFGHKAEHRKKTGLCAKDEKGKRNDGEIDNKKRESDVDAGIFFQNHRNDVGAAAACFAVKQDCGTDRR